VNRRPAAFHALRSWTVIIARASIRSSRSARLSREV
jgi:hypothetical protein